jgi:hypothetical protein
MIYERNNRRKEKAPGQIFPSACFQASVFVSVAVRDDGTCNDDETELISLLTSLQLLCWQRPASDIPDFNVPDMRTRAKLNVLVDGDDYTIEIGESPPLRIAILQL